MAGGKEDFSDLLKSLAAPVGLPSLPPGALIDGRYRIVRLVGQGAMGEVYAAVDVTSEEQVALKVMKPALSGDRQCLLRFAFEAQAASRIGHPNIVSVLHHGELGNGRPYFCMELLLGRTMRDVMRQGPLDERRLVSMARQLCAGLGAAHKLGIVHRDIKPSNVFLVQHNGEQDHVKLGDFGVSLMVDAATRLTSTGIAIGTPHFMAPEQALGERAIDHRVDVYALGVLLYYGSTGRPPFDAPTFAELVVEVCTGTPVPAGGQQPGPSEKLAGVIEIAIARHPSQRFQSMDAMAVALAHV